MVRVLPTVLSLEGHKNFPEVVPVIAEIPLALPSSEGRGKLGSGSEMALPKWDLGSTGTTVWFTVEYCHSHSSVTIVPWLLQTSSVGLSRVALWVCLPPCPQSEHNGQLLLLFQQGHPRQSDISVGYVWFVLGTVDPEIRLWQLDCHKIAGSAPFMDVQFHQRRF